MRATFCLLNLEKKLEKKPAPAKRIETGLIISRKVAKYKAFPV
jgi:hypothetical protein